jgi:hypothetical protein
MLLYSCLQMIILASFCLLRSLVRWKSKYFHNSNHVTYKFFKLTLKNQLSIIFIYCKKTRNVTTQKHYNEKKKGRGTWCFQHEASEGN